MQNLRELINIVNGAFIQVPLASIEVYRADTYDRTTIMIKNEKSRLSVYLRFPDIDIKLTKNNIGLIERFTHDLMKDYDMDIYEIDDIIKDNLDTIKKLLKLYTGYDQAKYIKKIKLLNQAMVTLNNRGKLNDNQIIKIDHMLDIKNACVIMKKLYDMDRKPFVSFEMSYGDMEVPFTLTSSHLPEFISYDTFKKIKDDDTYFAATKSLMDMLDYMTEKDAGGNMRFFEYIEIKEDPTAKNIATLIRKIKQAIKPAVSPVTGRNVTLFKNNDLTIRYSENEDIDFFIGKIQINTQTEEITAKDITAKLKSGELGVNQLAWTKRTLSALVKSLS